MPPTRQSRKRRAPNEVPQSNTSEISAPSTRGNKRRATQAAATAASNEPSSSRGAVPERPAPARQRSAKKEVFGESIVFGLDSEDEEIDKVIDLVDKDEVPDDEVPPSEPNDENIIKLGSFQCVICMDDVTGLTVTHCGHLFCSECLHSSLHIDASKKVCPICRQKIETNPAAGKFTSKSKGFWPLELKLMTAKRNGKRAAR